MAEAEAVLLSWLRSAFPSARVVSETPADLTGNLPCIRVRRIGGANDSIGAFDNPVLDFDCYDDSMEAARTLAYAVRDSVHDAFPGQTAAGGFCSKTRTLSGPVWTPYDNTAVRRFTYSAQLRLRSL